MEIKITADVDNPLLLRRDIQAAMDFPGKPTPKNDEVLKLIAEKEKADPSAIVIRKIRTSFGKGHAIVTASVYKSEADKKKIELAKKSKKGSEAEKKGPEPEMKGAEPEKKTAQPEKNEQPAEAKHESKPESKAEAKPESKAQGKPEAKAEGKPEAKKE
ncbi:hypothetical protein HYU14_02000 [Candidatus Woesearchaeota archaeon]|nr:hypothetical protein [Candidatus Woesearchaeota archaeon]